MTEPVHELPEPGEPVTVAWVANGRWVDYSFFHSWTALLGYDQGNYARVWQGGFIDMRAGTDGLVDCRNKAVRMFLDERESQWLMWLDTDMGFPPDIIDRLLEVADPVQRPVVGALCFASIESEPDGMGGWKTAATPTIFDWAHDGDHQGYAVRWDYPPDTVVGCHGTGSAAILIHRSALEKVKGEFGTWYTRLPNPTTGQLISEDLSFCVRLGALDIPVFVHTGVKTTHAKPMWLSETHYWQQRAVNPSPWKPEPRTPAVGRTWTVPRYAIIPTHNRPARLLSLVVSLGQQCDHIVIIDNASQPPVDVEKLRASVPDRVNVWVIRDELQPPNLAYFWNLMLDRCAADGHEQWDIAVLNDDSVVPAGWYDACANGLRAHPTAVVAHTNPTTPALLTEVGENNPGNRMTPHAFVVRGEHGQRADESMHWWYQDTDWDWTARLNGGVLSVPGPRVINALANTTTRGVLAEQAQKDKAAFEAKWSR